LQPLVPTMLPHEHCEDFRSYALRAFVIASTTKENLIALSERNKYQRLESDSFPEPYPGFRDAVEWRLNAMFVSHRSERRVISKRKLRYLHKGAKKTTLSVAVRGSLHKETIYGKHLHPDGEHYFHIRKPLEFVSTQHQIEKVVDPQVRKQLEAMIAKSGGYKDGKVPLHCFFDKDDNGKLIPKVFMPNYRGGDPVPIRKVRLREVMHGAVQLKSGLNQYVNLRNNHHIVIYKNRKGELSEHVVSYWEAVQRCVSQQPLYQLPEDGLEWITTLHINDLFILGVEDLEEDLSKESRPFLMQHLYRVQKLSSKFYEFRLAYNNTIQQTDAPIYIRINNFGDRKTGWNKHYPTKVRVSITGQLQRAALQTTKKLSSMR
jgi:CRISPR-associated endonuclease Csn1